jgi:pyruvate kinase
MAMTLPNNKTKIVATVGPASNSPEMLESLIRAGMNIARLNFSHGSFDQHAEVVTRIRTASKATGRRVAIMGDLPGPKMRLGTIEPDPIHLTSGDSFTLTSQQLSGNARRVSMNFEPLPSVVKPGDRLFLNDGLVQLLVDRVEGKEVHCTVAVGGELRSRKGLNLPRINLGISAFTDHDRKCLEFALRCDVDAISQSFVERGADVETMWAAAADLGKAPFVIAKIERYESIQLFDEILAAADGVMIARGDLGVEVPIEEITVLQKQLIA